LTPPVTLTAEQVEAAAALWESGASAFEICLELGITVDTFKARRRDQLRHLPKRSRSELSGRRGDDPSEDEIRIECERIRANWTDQQFRER
jgi:DNA-binding CsgD family transcriptional regulator